MTVLQITAQLTIIMSVLLTTARFQYHNTADSRSFDYYVRTVLQNILTVLQITAHLAVI